MSQPPLPGNFQLRPQGSSGLSVASFVLGIVAIVLTIVLFCFPFIGGALGVLAIILGGVALAQSTPAVPTGKAKTGLILGIISVVLAVSIIAAAHAGINFLNRNAPKWQQELQQKADQMKQQADDAQKKAAEDQQKLPSSTQP